MRAGGGATMEAQLTDLVGRVAPQPPPAPQRPVPSQPVPKAAQIPPAPRAPVVEEPAAEFELHPELEPLELIQPATGVAGTEGEFGDEFDVNRLSPEEQELHRRANRVAKVSMQDIKMLRPEQVRLGRQNRSEEHTSELQSHLNLVCRLLLEKKKQSRE